MNCKEFKERVADLFDTTVDMQTQVECQQHMDECNECRAYYNELAETFKALQPKAAKSQHATVKSHRRIWQSAAAAAILIIGIVIGWSDVFSTPAAADNTRSLFWEQGIRSVQNVGSVKMTAFVRTTPNENFAHFDPGADFVAIDIAMMRQNDSLFYRVEKQGGRIIVCDGEAQYMWVPGILYTKGPRLANFLENFSNLIYPDRLLAMQKSAVEFSEKNKITRTETDTTITITFFGTERNGDLQQLLETGKMGDCQVEVENIFSKNDNLLRFVKLWIVEKGKKTLMLHIDNIQYNVMLSRAAIIRVPDAEWRDCTVSAAEMDASRLHQLRKESAAQAAQRIMKALIEDDATLAREALVPYKNSLAKLTEQLRGCTATDFLERKDKSYAGTYVFYTLIHPDGKCEKRHLAVRNDNPNQIWMADGGL